MTRNIRINIFTVTIALICLGIVMIYSASSIYAWERYNDSAFFLKRHLSFMIIGALIAFLLMGIDYRKFRKWSKPLVVITLFLLDRKSVV